MIRRFLFLAAATCLVTATLRGAAARELSVAEVAAGSLGRITGDNLGYERELPEEKRRKALDRWRKKMGPNLYP